MNEQKLLKIKQERETSLNAFVYLESSLVVFDNHRIEFRNEWWSQHSGLDVSYIEGLRAGRLPLTTAVTRCILIALYPAGAPEDLVAAIVEADRSLEKLSEALQLRIND